MSLSATLTESFLKELEVATKLSLEKSKEKADVVVTAPNVAQSIITPHIDDTLTSLANQVANASVKVNAGSKTNISTSAQDKEKQNAQDGKIDTSQDGKSPDVLIETLNPTPPTTGSKTDISDKEKKIDSPPLSNGNNSVVLNGGKPTSESMAEEEQSWYLVGANQPTDIEIEVIRTNWLYRAQKRIFKFTDVHFIRIQPENGHHKDTFLYPEVSEIQFTNTSNLVIKFNNGKEAQYLNTPRASEIVDIIHRRNPGVKVLKY